MSIELCNPEYILSILDDLEKENSTSVIFTTSAWHCIF